MAPSQQLPRWLIHIWLVLYQSLVRAVHWRIHIKPLKWYGFSEYGSWVLRGKMQKFWVSWLLLDLIFLQYYIGQSTLRVCTISKKWEDRFQHLLKEQYDYNAKVNEGWDLEALEYLENTIFNTFSLKLFLYLGCIPIFKIHSKL